MPKGKSAKQYKTMSFINSILGIIMLAALVIGLYFAFNFVRSTGIFESGM